MNNTAQNLNPTAKPRWLKRHEELERVARDQRRHLGELVMLIADPKWEPLEAVIDQHETLGLPPGSLHRVHCLPAGAPEVEPVAQVPKVIAQPKVIAPKVKKLAEVTAKPPHVGQRLDGTLDDADATVDQMLPTGEAILRAHALIEALTGIRLKLGHSFTRRFERAARRLEGEGRVVVERPGRQSGEPNRFSDEAVELVARAIAARC